jgi:hypothetical protein
MSIKIEVATKTQILGTYPVGSSSIVVGRSSSCDIRIPSTMTDISSRHLIIREKGGELWVLDGDGHKASTNGVYIDQARIAANKWINVPATKIICLGNPTSQNCIHITIIKSKPAKKVLTNSIGYSASSGTTSGPLPVQLTNAGVNVSIVRPERTRSRWTTPGNLLIHLIGLGICIAILPFVTGSALEAGIVITLIIAFEIYFFPSTISFNRDLPNRFAILALNLFLGWTLLGWVVCLVWSLTAR